MRQLNTGDAFKVLQIFRAAGIKDDFAGLVNSAFVSKSSVEVGSKIFAMLFNCLGHEKAEPLIIKLLADIAQVKPDEIMRQPIPKTVALLKGIVEQNDINSFFGNAAALTK